MKHPKVFVTDDATSKRMANVKLKRGNEETVLAKSLWVKGFRYRLNYKKLPGSPDIAINKYKIAIFVDGEFWHGYDWNNKKEKLIRNREYWIAKIEENIIRDKRVDYELNTMGWFPMHFWSKDVKGNCSDCVEKIINKIDEIENNKN